MFSGLFCKYYYYAYQILIKLVRIYFYKMIYSFVRFFGPLQAPQTHTSEDIASAIELLCLKFLLGAGPFFSASIVNGDRGKCE